MASETCIVTAYFNPCRYFTRKFNFDTFAARLSSTDAKLLVIEMALKDGSFELDDKHEVIRARGGDVMWQKERLLNIAIASLPAPEGDELPSVRVGVDPWNWKAGKPHAAERVVERILSTMAHEAGIGLVFHPQCLRDGRHRRMMDDLLRCLVGAGCAPTRIDPQLAP